MPSLRLGSHNHSSNLFPCSSTNILGLVVFAVVTGIAIAQCGEDGKPLLKFFESISIVMMKVVTMEYDILVISRLHHDQSLCNLGFFLVTTTWIKEDNTGIVKFKFVKKIRSR